MYGINRRWKNSYQSIFYVLGEFIPVTGFTIVNIIMGRLGRQERPRLCPMYQAAGDDD